MKKMNFLKWVSLFLLPLFSGISLNGQNIILTEDFESGSPPTGWSTQQNTNSVGFEFGTNLGSQFFNIPAHTRYAASNDDKYDDNSATLNDASMDYLISPPFNTTGMNALFLQFATYFTGEYGSEGTVEISYDGGATWTSVYTIPADPSGWQIVTVDLSNYTDIIGLQIGFHHDDNGQWASGLAIDDVKLFEPNANDIQLVDLDFNEELSANSCISGTIKNLGANPLNSFNLYWQIDGGQVFMRPFSGLNINPTETFDFSNGYPLELTNAGSQATIKVWVDEPNDAPDGDTTNNSITRNPLIKIGVTVKKRVLIEEFSTAPCGWCPDGAVVLEDVLSNHPDAIAAQHHAGFGTDAMTIPEHSAYASAFTSGAPTACIDRFYFEGEDDVAISRSIWEDKTVERLNVPTSVCVEIAHTYNSASREISATVSATFFDFAPANDYRVNLFVIEDVVTGTGSGYDQTNYLNNQPGHPFYNAGDPIVGYEHKHVVRAVPSGTWGDNSVIPQNPVPGQTYSGTYTYTLPASYDEDEITLVAFVSEYHTDVRQREIFNAISADLLNSSGSVSCEVGDTVTCPVTWDPTGIAKPAVKSRTRMNIHPNPTSDELNVYFTLKENTPLRLEISNLLGQRIDVVRDAYFTAGPHTLTLNLKKLPEGVYYINMYASDDLIETGKIVINR